MRIFCNILYNKKMRYNFVKFGITSTLELNQDRRDYLFFEQNKDKFTQIFDFLSGPKDCFILSGFQGVGKSKILDEAISYLNDEVLLFRYQMYEATTLDDILLNLTLDFREFQKNEKTVLPKIDTKDFRERIQYYVKNIEKPMLLVLESYENVLKYEDTSGIINDFLFHLASIDKFKVIFVSRSFDSQILIERNVDYDKAIITSIDEDIIEQYFTRYNIKTTQESLKKLISGSRCYLKYIDMTIKILQTFNISLEELMYEFEMKKTNFSNFLIGKFISLIPERSRELVYILTLIRTAATPEFLAQLTKNSVTEVSYLKNILILNEDKTNVYVKDYFKKEIEKEIDQFSTLKIHNYLANFYESMLPKKPTERILTISRNTMRREKAYHESFVENYHASGMRTESGITFSTMNSKSEAPAQPTTDTKEQTTTITSPIELNLETEILPTRKEPHINPAYNLDDYVKLAEKYERDFDYQSAIFYYQKALEKNQDTAFGLKRPNILVKMAQCYVKTHSHENAIQCLTLAYETYFQQKQFTLANEAMYELALEYKNNYKFYVAKNCIDKILNSQTENPAKLLAKSYNLLADIEDLSSNVILAKSLYKKALDNALKTDDKEILSTAYFKYGLLLDDTNQQTQAMECYQNCINVCPNPQKNIYLSSAYSNLAGIYYEREDIRNALTFYQKALEADKSTHNNEGMYFVYTKLSAIYENRDKQTSYKFLLNALQATKRLGDKLYIASAYLEIGDYYYRQHQYPQAIKAYLSANHFLDTETDKENKSKIETRLKDLKIKLGETQYNLTANGFRYNDET